MNLDTDQVVYFIKRNKTFAAGTINYGSGEFYSDEFEFNTKSPSQAGSVKQLGEWMEKMESLDTVDIQLSSWQKKLLFLKLPTC